MCDEKRWKRIKTEYLKGGTSYAKLAQKHGLTKNIIAKRARAEGWADSRTRIGHDVDTRVEASIADQQVDRFMKMYALADRFQDQIGELMAGELRSGRDAHDLGDALLDAVQLIRDLYNLPNEQQRQGRERLAIMREDLVMRKQEQQKDESAEQTAWVIHMEDDADEND